MICDDINDPIVRHLSGNMINLLSNDLLERVVCVLSNANTLIAKALLKETSRKKSHNVLDKILDDIAKLFTETLAVSDISDRYQLEFKIKNRNTSNEVLALTYVH